VTERMRAVGRDLQDMEDALRQWKAEKEGMEQEASQAAAAAQRARRDVEEAEKVRRLRASVRLRLPATASRRPYSSLVPPPAFHH